MEENDVVKIDNELFKAVYAKDKKDPCNGCYFRSMDNICKKNEMEPICWETKGGKDFIFQKIESGVDLINAERERQIKEEGWSMEHDDIANNDEQLAQAAALYALPECFREYEYSVNNLWPWDKKWWKPTPDDRIRELAKAGALIAAEIDRLQRIQN